MGTSESAGSAEPDRPVINIEIPIVGAALGHSLIWEEYKGNFAVARADADSAVQSASDRETETIARLALGIVQMLQGDFTDARKSFDAIGQVELNSPDLKYFAFTCGYLADMYKYRLGPSGGILTSELEQRWDGAASAGEAEERFAKLRGQAKSASAHMQSALVFQVLSMMPVQRQMVDTAAGSLGQEQLQQFTAGLMQGAWQFQGAAIRTGARIRITAFIDSLAADLARRAGLPDIAGTALRRSLETYTNDGDAAGAACCHLAWGDWNAAPSSSPAVWNLVMKEGAGDGTNITWVDEMREFRQDGANLQEARLSYDIAEEGFKTAGAERGQAAIRLRRAYLSILDDDPKQAEALSGEAQDLAEAVGDRLLAQLARVSRAMARVWISHRYGDEAGMREVGLWGAASGSLAYASGLGLLASRLARHFQARRGDYQRAATCYRMARTLFEGLGMIVNEAHTFIDLGNLSQAVGARSAGIEAYEAAFEGLRKAGEVYPKARGHLHRSEIQVDLQLYRLYEAMADPIGIARVVSRLSARIPATKHDLADSRHAMNNLVHRFLAGAKPEEEADTTEDLMDAVTAQFATSTVETGRVTGHLYSGVRAKAAGHADEAEQEFQTALKLARSARVASPDYLEAVVFAQKREYDFAVTAYEAYLAQGGASGGFVGTLVRRLVTDSATGIREREAQDRREHQLAATFLLRCHRYDKARQEFAGLEELAGPDWWASASAAWEIASDYGEIFEGRGEFDTALDWYDRGIGKLEQNRALLTYDELKTALANQRGSRFLYFNAARAAIRRRQALEAEGDESKANLYASRAFSYGEGGRARALLDMLASGESDSEAALSVRRFQADLSLRKDLLGAAIESGTADAGRIAALREQIGAGEESLATAELQLAAQQREPGANVKDETLSLAEVRELIEPGGCILEYFFMGEDLLIWILSGDGMIASRLIPAAAAELTISIEKLRSLCEAQLAGAHLAAVLAQQLLAPVATTLRKFRRVMIVPHGGAHHLPFHVLPIDGRIFGESHTLSYLPSVSTLKYIRRRWRGLGDSVLGVGNPSDMALTGWDGISSKPAAALPLAGKEVATVCSFFPDSEILLGHDATKRRVLDSIGKYRALHFATHGHLDPEQASLSRILLAGGESLSVVDLSGIRLDADLVVLSACETGRGAATGGDEVLGLARAFLSAGARCLVLSLWKVDDAATMILMVELYRALQRGSDPASALREAQTNIRAMSLEHARSELSLLLGDKAGAAYDAPNWGQPFFWAPFVVMGANQS